MRPFRRLETTGGSSVRPRLVQRLALIATASLVVACNGALPSGLPSGLPSVGQLPSLALPSRSPLEPSRAPSVAPTKPPTPEPTAVPSEPPTAAPTERPTAEPSTKPSTAPVETPAPTARPTTKPSSSAVAEATATPSPTPTPNPTPTLSPTPSPTPASSATPGPTISPIQARFVASTVAGDPPVVVRFDDQSGGTITYRLWTFGDGDISTETSPTHRYTQDGLYTVTLTVWGPDGSDTRVKSDLIAVGSLSELLADNQDREFTDQPAFWLALAVSPPVALFLGLRDRFDHGPISKVVDDGHSLATLIAARNASTTPGAVDVAIETFLDGAARIRHRLNGTALENLDRSTSIARDLRNILLAELALRLADPNDPRLAAAGQAVLDRLDEFNASVEQVAASS